MYKMSKGKPTQKDFFNNSNPMYEKINQGMEMLFSDIEDIICSEVFELSEDKIELFKEMLANELYYHYTVLHSPLNTHTTSQ